MGSLLVEHADRPSNFVPFIYFKDLGRFIQWRRVGLSDLPCCLVLVTLVTAVNPRQKNGDE
jgi:hypothetical protein